MDGIDQKIRIERKNISVFGVFRGIETVRNGIVLNYLLIEAGWKRIEMKAVETLVS